MTSLGSGVPCQLSAEAIRRGDLDDVIRAWDNRCKRLQFERLPNRIYLVRHGQSEGNINPKVYHHKGDSRLELTAKGIEQAHEAGARLAGLIAERDAQRKEPGKIFIGVSPFERAQQTLYGMYDGGLPRDRVGVVLHDPRLREQEFGNFQPPGLSAAVRAEIASVGRFYYRRPNAESSADVFDRIAAFWQCLLSDGPDNLLLGRTEDYDTCVLVTHGLTIRLLLMVVCQWSVETFETVFNIGNCQHLTLRKNVDKLGYELCPEESFPPRVPWSSRKCWIVFKSLRSSEETLRQIALLKQLRASEQGIELGRVFGEKKPVATLTNGSQRSERTVSRDAPSSSRPSQHERERSENAGREQADQDSDDDELVDEPPSWPFLDHKIAQLEAQAMDERSRPFTVVDYLTLPCPRSMNVAEAVKRCVPSHNVRGPPEQLLRLARETNKQISLEDIEAIDWWGPDISPDGRKLRMRMDRKNLISRVLDVTPGGRAQAIPAPHPTRR